ncbi:hypothetical protein SFB5_090G2, partial [Candidatus Arthromitus sp. SFB-5]
TGFGLCAIVIGAFRGYIDYKSAYERSLNTLKSVYFNASNTKGFFNHFLNMETGKTAWNSEVSIIDTALFVMGALVSSEYFGLEVSEYFEKIYSRIDWGFFRNKGSNRFIWVMMTEQILILTLNVLYIHQQHYFLHHNHIPKYSLLRSPSIELYFYFL